MLILARKVGERVMVGEPGSPNHLVIEVCGTRGGTVSLGFTADRSVRIVREEVAHSRRPAASRPHTNDRKNSVDDTA